MTKRLVEFGETNWDAMLNGRLHENWRLYLEKKKTILVGMTLFLVPSEQSAYSTAAGPELWRSEALVYSGFACLFLSGFSDRF